MYTHVYIRFQNIHQDKLDHKISWLVKNTLIWFLVDLSYVFHKMFRSIRLRKYKRRLHGHRKHRFRKDILESIELHRIRPGRL